MIHFGLFSFAKQAAPGAAPGGMFGDQMVSTLILFGVLFLVFYFIVIRPEKKRRTQMQQMLNELKKGDRVVTIGGIHGTVSGVTEKTVIVQVSDQTKIEFSRQAIGSVIKPDGEVKGGHSKEELGTKE